jgi:hypothetical protein
MSAIISLIDVLLANSSKGMSKFLTDRSILEMPCTTSGNYVEIGTKEKVLVLAEEFSDQTLDPVATNGITDLFRYGNAEPRMFTHSLAVDDEETGCRTLAANN